MHACLTLRMATAALLLAIAAPLPPSAAQDGAWGGMEGIDADAFPQTMEIDYVRVYQ